MSASEHPSLASFRLKFEALTGKRPFPWQEELFLRFARGEIPACCDLPTGLGKTSVVAIWLIALAELGITIPRRLVYVVNRRTVVDQTTAEVEKIYRNLDAAGLRETLASLCALPGDVPLAISTLRGQFADNREWSGDPCRPAVIVGTVDMMGSRLLFGGYRIGFKTRPLHAGFLGQDSLIVHDEAHLEPAFQTLLTALEHEQERCGDKRRIRVMELSATPRSEGEPFRISPADEEHPEVAKRLGAAKRLTLHEMDDAAKVPARLIELARRHQASGLAVLVFANGVKDVEQIAAALEKEAGKKNVARLTGTMRGKERDELVKTGVFQRMLPSGEPTPGAEPAAAGTVYLVCTSAGEVGINISADHLVCDLSTFDSMAQRFGRVNRFGLRTDTEIDVVHPAKFEEKPEREQRKAKTLKVLRQLAGSASPNAIRALPLRDRQAAFNPDPQMRPTSDILFDAWSFTTITELPGRPPLADYLHGIVENEIPETQVAWREEVDLVRGESNMFCRDLLADYPLKPHELLRDNSARVWDALAKLARDAGKAGLPVWLVEDDGTVNVQTLAEIADKRGKERIFHRTLLLPPAIGGLSGGLLDGSSDDADDIADEWPDEDGRRKRIRLWSDDQQREEKSRGMRIIRGISLQSDAGEEVDGESDSDERRWLWFEVPRSADSEGSRTAVVAIPLADHTGQVESIARTFAEKSGLSPELVEAVALAGKFHDAGKNRRVWQLSIGNATPGVFLAKSGKKFVPHQLGSYRHEFGSVLDLESAPEFQRLSDEMKDVVLHLVAAHHGRARPHFPADESFDPQHPHALAAALAAETARRFARLQRRFGRWGLAWLESLLRAADYAASANPNITWEAQP